MTPPAAREASAVPRPTALALPALAPQAARTWSNSRCTRCTGREGSSVPGRRGFQLRVSRGQGGQSRAHGSGEPRHPPWPGHAPAPGCRLSPAARGPGLERVRAGASVHARSQSRGHDAWDRIHRTAWPLRPNRARARRWPPTRCTAFAPNPTSRQFSEAAKARPAEVEIRGRGVAARRWPACSGLAAARRGARSVTA